MSAPIINIHLENKYAGTWRKYSYGKAQVWIRGVVFWGDRFCGENNMPPLFARLASLLDDASFSGSNILLNMLNGFFAVIIQTEQKFIAAVDRVRSIPLFYGQTKGQVFLSDNAEWVRRNVGDTKMCPVTQKEFLLTGYVTGQETLFSYVRQLQAGEMLHNTQDDNGLRLHTQRYYRYQHKEPSSSVNEELLLAELDAVSKKSVERLIEFANGQQIVVPLSAGYDSRLIVALLRRLKYENVLTFSYGVPGNGESSISQMVAESLNYAWAFVPYSRKLWRQWRSSKEWLNYQRWASGWASTPSIQDWPAVWQLKLTGRLSENAIFVPGHSADLLAGSRSKSLPLLYNSGSIKYTQVIDAILGYHYTLNPIKEKYKSFRSIFADRILENIGTGTGYINPASSFESWDVSERQAKFIINSVRIYEFWGYEWYLPFWDMDFMAFWERVPLQIRVGKHFYDRYVEEVYKKNCIIQLDRITHEQVNKEKSRIIHFVKDAIGNALINTRARRAYILLSQVKSYWDHPLSWYGIYSFNKYLSEMVYSNIFRTSGFCINSLIAKEMITDYEKSAYCLRSEL